MNNREYMPAKKPFYITTTLPYVNAEPHVGHALEFIRADIIARSKRLAGYDVFFNTGTDEHGIKVYQKALQLNLAPQAYVDQASTKFREILPALGMATSQSGIRFNFIRTTDPHHIKAAQAFWTLVKERGDKASDGPYIYKKNYSVKYCVGCELEKTESELVNGRCPLHALQELEIIAEENYFFKFSAFADRLLALYADRPDFVVPASRLNEIQAFVSRGLDDFSVSRLAAKMPWGVPVPGDPTHVMYVWFDALVDYISAIGWPDDEVAGMAELGAFKKWWIETGGVVQYCGKDNLRQQSAMWQAMLMAAGLPPSKAIVVNGFVTGEGGIKMSKSLGNVINPLDVAKEYGTDALRYYVAREISPFEDSPFTLEKFKEAYNANLANGIGNLTSRIMKMAEANIAKVSAAPALSKEYIDALERYDIKSACDFVWAKIGALDALIQKEEPFKKLKVEETKAQALALIEALVRGLAEVALHLEAVLPETAERIQECIAENATPATPLFMRK
jgi:methionyl-tRNA synthetase